MNKSRLRAITHVLAVIAVMAFAIQNFSDNKADVDLWGNVGFVKAMPSSPAFMRVNTFSFTEPDHPWINHEWLAEYIFHLTYTCLGNTCLLALKLLLGLCVILLINKSMTRAHVSGPVRFLYLLLIISTMGYGFSTRPHHFTYLMYALFLFMLKYHVDNRRMLLLLIPALGVIWVNLHGAFFVGLMLLLVFLTIESMNALLHKETGQRSKRRLLTLAAATVFFFLVTFINPFGVQTWDFILESASKPRPYLSEWAPFNPATHFLTHIDFVVLSLVTVAAFLASCKRPPRHGLVEATTPACAAGRLDTRHARPALLTLSFVAAIMMRRNIPIFAITAGFAGAEYVENAVGPQINRIFSRMHRGIIPALLAVFSALSLYYGATFNKTNPLEIEIPARRFPIDTVSFMSSNNIRGNALVFFDWAEYCIWKIYPDCRVFLDGRFRSAYSLRTIDDYFNFLYLGDNWDNALENYPTDIVLIHSGNPVAPKMCAMPGWQLAHTHGNVCLFLKKDVHAKFLANMERGAVKSVSVPPPHYFP